MEITKEQLTCSITHELMKDPIVDKYGYVFERNAIEQWYSINSYHPINRNKVNERDKILISCHMINSIFNTYYENHPEDDERPLTIDSLFKRDVPIHKIMDIISDYYAEYIESENVDVHQSRLEN